DNEIPITENQASGSLNPETSASDNEIPITENQASGSLNPEIATAELPALTGENWPEIVHALTAELGATVWLAQHASFIAREDGRIVLSFHAAAAPHLRADRVRDLGEVLARHYATDPHLKTVPWQDSYLSVLQIRQQRQAAAQQHAQTLLANDPQAQAIARTFGGQWLPESVELQPSTQTA
ncbi:MAG: hypothetical protein Q4G42_08095, partial [Neisseria sp.]|nr:hypothetical protein [Neisseria sp.]